MIDRLSGKARSSAARQDGNPVSGGGRDHCHNVIRGPRQDHGYRLDLVDTRIGAVQQAGHAVGPDLAVNIPAQFLYEIAAVSFNVFGKHGHV